METPARSMLSSNSASERRGVSAGTDVALAAGQTLAGVRRGDVTFAGQDVSVVADAAVPPPVRWKERRAAHTDAGPPPWATAPKKRGVRERRS